jgi:superfamily II DNA/RNA helicase
MLQALIGVGYDDLTEVQKMVIPAALSGKDVIVSSQTGSGKTAAFAIPVCENLILNQRNPQVLVLTPTRELAVQVKQTMTHIGRFKQIRCAAIFGKQSMQLQRNELRQRVHVIVGTPGRTFDHIEKGNLNLTEIGWLIIDEADKMLDLGFIDQVEAIINQLPPDRVTMVFSATLPQPVQTLCAQYMKTPLRIDVDAAAPLHEKIQQSYYAVREPEKAGLVLNLLYAMRPQRCILFCNTRERVDALAEEFKRTDWRCASLHGGMEQRDRLQTMQDFKRGRFQILIATDVAARGIHVDNISLVVNVDMPFDNESYIHRIGRTGRQENCGVAISLVTPAEHGYLAGLEANLQYRLRRQEPPSLQAVEQGKHLVVKKSRPPVPTGTIDEQLNRAISRIRINAGRKEKMRPGDILGAVTAIPGITASDIGIIDIQDACSYVEIFNDKGEDVLDALARAKIKGKLRTIRRVGFREL